MAAATLSWVSGSLLGARALLSVPAAANACVCVCVCACVCVCVCVCVFVMMMRHVSLKEPLSSSLSFSLFSLALFLGTALTCVCVAVQPPHAARLPLSPSLSQTGLVFLCSRSVFSPNPSPAVRQCRSFQHPTAHLTRSGRAHGQPTTPRVSRQNELSERGTVRPVLWRNRPSFAPSSFALSRSPARSD